jgi:hypothetical protein
MKPIDCKRAAQDRSDLPALSLQFVKFGLLVSFVNAAPVSHSDTGLFAAVPSCVDDVPQFHSVRRPVNQKALKSSGSSD